MNPSATKDLVDATCLLVRGMSHDARLGLILSSAWLDPLCLAEHDYLYEQGEEMGGIAMALNVAYLHWPTVYIQMVQGLHSGWTSAQFSDFFCTHFGRRYPDIPLVRLDDMCYGVPLDFRGLEPLNLNFASEHPDLANILEQCFSIGKDNEQAFSEDDFTAARSVAHRIIRSLIAQDCQPYADLALMLMYLFSETGNTLLEYTLDDYWDAGFEQSYWERKEDLEDAQEANHQVAIVLAATERALATLDSRPNITAALCHNILAVQSAIERNDPDVSLKWPDRGRRYRAARSAQRGAGPGVGLLFVRNCYADSK